MIDIKEQIKVMIAKLRAEGLADAAEHAETAILPLIRERTENDDDAYEIIAGIVSDLMIAAVDDLEGDPFDLATLCYSTVVYCMKHVHDTTQVHATSLMRSVAKSMIEMADAIEGQEDNDGPAH